MPNILDYLNTISEAVYGKDVRQAIVDAISTCYEDGKAGVNDLEARRLIESAIAVNEDQQADIDTLYAEIAEIQGGGGESSQESTSITLDTIIFDGGFVDSVSVANNATATYDVTFEKEFTEVPEVFACVAVQNSAGSAYSKVTVGVVKSQTTTTGFRFFIANTSGASRSVTVVWAAFQPTTQEIDLDITIPSGDGMSEADVRAITNPIQTALNGVKTGYDGTEYSTPGEAVRTQINDLHVLIGDEPGTAIDASAISYGEDSNVEDALDDVNERLVQLDDAVLEKIVNAKSGTYNATAGTSIPSQTHLIDVSIPAGTAFKFVLNADGIVSKYHLYANGNVLKYSLVPGTEYELTAASDITWISIYAPAGNVTGSGPVTGVVSITTLNDNSLESKVKRVGEETINALTNPFVLSANDLEDGAIRNGTGKDFAAEHRARTKIYIPVKAGTVVKCSVAINVWEYNLVTKAYITDRGDWVYPTSSYTVENDCFIRIMWNTLTGGVDLTYQELLNRTEISFLKTFNNALIDQDYVKRVNATIIEEQTKVNLPSITVRSIAHRGDDIDGPQCTAPAYILARKRGFTVAENDLWLSEDGEFVMWHDTNLARLGNMVDINGYLMYTDGTDLFYVHPTTNAVYTWDGTNYVSSSVALSTLDRCNGSNYGVNSQYSVIGLPLSILKRIDFGLYKGAKFQGTQILTFAEWVLLCKQLGMEIYIDRKLAYTDALLTQAANIVKRYGMAEYTSWLSLTLNQIELLRTLIPGARCGILDHPREQYIQAYTPYNNGRGFFFNGDAKNGMTEASIHLALDAGFDVEVWYVDVPSLTAEQVYETIRTAVSYGVTGMTLDHYRVDDAFKSLIESY